MLKSTPTKKTSTLNVKDIRKPENTAEVLMNILNKIKEFSSVRVLNNRTCMHLVFHMRQRVHRFVLRINNVLRRIFAGGGRKKKIETRSKGGK